MDISLNICTKPIVKKTKVVVTPTLPNASENINKLSQNSKFQFKRKKHNNNDVKHNDTTRKIIEDNQTVASGFEFVNKKQKSNNATPEQSSENKKEPIKDHFVPKNKTFPLFSKDKRQKQFPKNESIEVKKTENVFGSKEVSFTDLNVHDYVVQYLHKKGINKATHIQQETIPKILKGKNLMIRSETGSGKTLAYALPIVHTLRSMQPRLTRKDGVQTLVIVPTRELALQTLEVFKELVYSYCWIVPGIVCGGENRKAEKERLRKGLNILIGTPGRLLDHLLHSANLTLDKVRCLVVDEADSLVDMGHKEDVKRIVTMVEESRNKVYDPMALLKGKKSEKQDEISDTMPLLDPNSKRMQTIFLSATLTKKVEELKDLILRDYDRIESDAPAIETSETSNVTAPNIKQKYIITDVKTRLVVLASLIVKRFEDDDCKMFIFMDTRQMVEYHEELFKKYLLDPTAKKYDLEEMEDSDDESEKETPEIELYKIHGDMEQKERSKTYKAFRNAKKGILLCTDAAARGIDIPKASYVIQYTAPLNTDIYLHRIGRTARAGLSGESIIFLTEPEMEYINHVMKEHNVQIYRITEEQVLKSLVGHMSHLGKMQLRTAAEKLQKRFEEAVEGNKHLFKLACQAYMSWYRYYRMFPGNHRQFFDAKKIHQGHYITSFAIKVPLSEIIKGSRKEVENTEKPEKKLNLKLSNNPDEERKAREFNKNKKRYTEVSEFDSGIKNKRKKNKKEK